MATVSKTFLTPPADVWNVIADGWLYSGWVVGASRIRDVDALWPAAGAVLHHSVGAWPLLINDKTTVTASDPGKSIELIARGWPLGEAKVVITLEPLETGCRVSIAEDAVKGPGLLVPKVHPGPAHLGPEYRNAEPAGTDGLGRRRQLGSGQPGQSANRQLTTSNPGFAVISCLFARSERRGNGRIRPARPLRHGRWTPCPRAAQP